MRIICRIPFAYYVQDFAGRVYYVPADGRRGYPIGHLDLEIASLRRNADEDLAEGRPDRAEERQAAAEALEGLLPTAPLSAA